MATEKIESLNKRSVTIVRTNPDTPIGEVFDFLKKCNRRWFLAIYDESLEIGEVYEQADLSEEEELLLFFNKKYQSNFDL